MTPGLVSREIADRLGLERAAVNSVLNEGRGEVFQQDATYRWRVVTPAADDGGETSHQDEPTGNLLARLCEYYLACLSHDNRNLSFHMQSDRFVELSALPDGERLKVSPETRELVESGRRETRSFDLVIGYPLLLRRIRSGLRVEPVLLLHVEAPDEASDMLRVVNDSLYVNPGAIEHLSDCDRDALSREVAHLETELGLNSDSELLLDEVIARLRAHRQGWPWADTCSPTMVGTDPPLLSLTEPGIHSRAIFALSERSSFTQGLESELTALSRLSLEQVRGTALGDWLEGTTAPVARKTEGERLLDVPPVNDEQHSAVERALLDKLTVVTGPPGTGKSQLVSNLLINSAWRNTSVLLSSKNNKAVDVVENRVNGLGVRPVVLRTGAGGYQRKLAADLVSMLTSSTSVEDRERYASAVETLEELRREKAEAWRQIEDLVALRNRVDALERDTERARSLAWTEVLETAEVRKRVERARLCLQSLTRSSRNPVLRFLARRLLRRGRLSRFGVAVERLKELPLPSSAPGDVSEESLEGWSRYLSRLSEDLDQAELRAEYRQALDQINRSPLDQLQLRYAELARRLREQSREVWKIWTGTLSDRLDAAARRTLGGQIAYLRMIGDADTELSGELYGVFREICTNAMQTFPVWASTALSARNRLPFEPGLFDLVVIDEASQCEIASALPLLYRARRAVIIGDPNQLQHISGIPRSADFQAMRRYGVGVELPSWSYSVNSLFDLANSLAATESLVNLVDHHRSHPAIIGFSDEAFYDGKLRVLTRPANLNMPRTRAGVMETAVRWIGCSGKAARAPGGGAENRLEAEKVCETLRRLIFSAEFEGSIGIVTPFRGQVNLIRKLVAADKALEEVVASREILVETAHRFQGDERDVMIFSPVLAEGISEGAVRFLRDTPNLFNVAVTRARAMLVVVGDRQVFSKQEGHLGDFEAYVRRVEAIDRGTDGNGDILDESNLSHWVRLFREALGQAGIDAVPNYFSDGDVMCLVVMSKGRRLDIEIDHDLYHRKWTSEQVRRDQSRTERLHAFGWNVRRFWVYQIRDDLEFCVASVKGWFDDTEHGMR